MNNSSFDSVLWSDNRFSGVGLWHYGVNYLAIVVLFLTRLALGAEDSNNRSAIEFRATGVISISGEHDKSSDRALYFSVFVKGNRWLIKTEPFAFSTNKHNTSIEYYEAGTNGTNVYSAALFNAAYDRRSNQESALAVYREEESRLAAYGKDPESLARIRSTIDLLSKQLSSTKPSPESRNKAVGEINVGVIPKFSELDLIAPIWLALCSKSVLGDGIQATNLVPGLFQTRGGTVANATEDANLFVTAQVQTSSQFPFLPVFIGFSNTAVWIPKKATSQKVKSVSVSDNPKLEATYEASFKSFGRLVLPSEFKLKQYSASIKTNIPVLRHTISGKIIEVKESVVLPDYLPRLPVVIAVADYRHIADNLDASVRVFTKPGEWPSEETVRNTKEYSRTLNRADRPAGKSQFKRAAVLFSITLVSSAFALLVWKMKIAQNNIVT